MLPILNLPNWLGKLDLNTPMHLGGKIEPNWPRVEVKFLYFLSPPDSFSFQEHVHFVSGTGGATGVSVNKSFKDASSPQEALEGLMNAMATSWSIRPYDYGYLAIIRALHKARYFFNIAPDEKSQLALLLETIQKCFDRNTCRGQDGRPPLTYSEVVEVCKMVATNHGYPELNLFQGWSLSYC